MSWQCPCCNTELKHLDYEVPTTSYEYGRVNLSSNNENRNDAIYYHDSQDCGESNWDDDGPTYKCPECGDEVTKETLVWQEEESTEEPIPIDKDDESQHNIIKPANQITERGKINSLDSNIICKECKHVFITNVEKYSNTEEYVSCPNCGETNSKKEYTILIQNGFFNHNITTHQHVVKKTANKLRKSLAKSK